MAIQKHNTYYDNKKPGSGIYYYDENGNHKEVLTENDLNAISSISSINDKVIALSSKTVSEIKSTDTVTATPHTATDGTIYYKLQAAPAVSDTIINGKNGISSTNQGTIWTIGISADYLSANALDKIKVASASWNEVSAKVNKDEFNLYKDKVSQDFINTSSWANNTFYPLNNNPSGYLTKHQSLDGLMSANLLGYNSNNEISSYNGHKFSNNFIAGSGIIIDGDTISTSGLVNTSSFTSSVNIINNYINGISGDVSAISSILEDKLYISSFSSVSGNFYTNNNPSGFINSSYVANELEKYYKKTETSSKFELDTKFGEIDDRFEPIETDVEILKANSAHNVVESSNEYIEVQSGTNKFTLTFTSGDLATKTWVDTNYQEKGNYLSANALDDLSGKWAFSADVNKRLEDTSAWANATFQPKGDYLSANALVDVSGKWNQVSAKLDSSATTDWDVTKYSGVNPIKVVNHEISIDLDDYFTKAETVEEIETRLANYGGYLTAASGTSGEPLIDNPSTKYIYLVKMETGPLSSDNYKEWIYTSAENIEQWECIGETTMDLTPYLTKEDAAELYQPVGNYVTSGNDITQGPAWVLVNDNDGVHWSGLDVSELGKKYIVTSTNHSLNIGSAYIGNTVTYDLSANYPGISGYNYVSAYYDENKDKYFVGLENHNVTYFAGNSTVTTSTILTNNIIPFNDGIKENITVTDGVFTIPTGVEKVTFCINETVEDNIVMNNGTAAHTFQLNKISLRCGGSVLLTTQDYYNNEVGYNELTLTYTVDLRNRESRDYTITYEGTPLTGNGVVNVNVSIKEDVIALSESTGGEGKTYQGIPGNKVIVDNNTNEIYLDTMPELSGVAPIYTSATPNYNLVGLNFDPEQFAISGEGLHSTLQIKIITSGGVIDQEAFEKLSNLINGRITETIPIGMINTVGTLGAGAAFSYLFRPVMEFDAYSGTVARVMTSNGTVGTSKSQVVISEVNETTHQIDIQWWSDKTTLTAQAGTLTLTAAPTCTETRTLYPDKLYYATLINYDQTTHYLGFSNNFTSDVGAYDIAYYDEHGAGDYGNGLPGSLHVVNPDKLGQTAGATLKPYIAFRNEV